MSGDRLGQLGEPEGGLGFGLFRGSEVGGQGVDLFEAALDRNPIIDHAGQADAWDGGMAASTSNLADALAHQSRPVDGSFPGDDQVNRAKAFWQFGQAREQFESWLQTGSEEASQSEAQSPRGPSAWFTGDVAAELFCRDGF